MKFNDLAAVLGRTQDELPAFEVAGVTEDSRRAGPGVVFFALSGTQTDGHDYAADAVARGAVAVVGERADVAGVAGAPYIRTAHGRRALGEAAQLLAGNPSERVSVIGVTGTNGKTSTVGLIRHVLEACGQSTAALGTLGNVIGGETLPVQHTTGPAEDVAKALQQAVEAGHAYAVMEVSSHALEQERVAGIAFRAGVFTNLTQDHLDYHADMEAYLKSKLRLFAQVRGPDGFTAVNAGDPAAERFCAASPVRAYTYGPNGDCRARDVHADPWETRFTAESPWGEAAVRTGLLGKHNVSNVLAALTTAGGFGVDFQAAAASVGALKAIPGRFERVDVGQEFQVIVDYAHTEDGLRNVLEAARAICAGRVLVVFGCGGDRDRTKRPKMGAVAAQLADWSFVTSDNPRTEDPERILDEVEAGLVQEGLSRDRDYVVIADRASAIAAALERAAPGDVVLIAGKGHEDYQIIGTERIHFDDRETARRLLEVR